VAWLRAADPDCRSPSIAVDYRGLEYQTGVSFSVFALEGRQELARGGRYSAGYPEDGVSEPATGFTLYMDAVLAASERHPMRPRLYLPRAPLARGRALAGQGLRRRARGRRRPAIAAEAKRLRCSHA
jgi:ATP phosphoribosyltransferase regulatory subunit